MLVGLGVFVVLRILRLISRNFPAFHVSFHIIPASFYPTRKRLASAASAIDVFRTTRAQLEGGKSCKVASGEKQEEQRNCHTLRMVVAEFQNDAFRRFSSRHQTEDDWFPSNNQWRPFIFPQTAHVVFALLMGLLS